MNRRRLLKGAGVAGVGAAVGGVSLLSFSEEVSADISHLGITGDTITTDDGTVDDVRVHLDELYAKYDGLEDAIDTVAFYLLALHNERPHILAHRGFAISEYGSLGTHAGSIGGGLGFADLSLLDNTESLEASDFEADDDGETEETDVTLQLQMNLNSGDETVASAARVTTVTFTVHNDESTVETGGHGDGTLEGENQDP